jgi:predicted acylesterase/phospholipase RssA
MRTSLALLALAALACGCIGAVVGTVVDTAQNAVERPVAEYVFRGIYKFDNYKDDPWRPLEEPRERDYERELVGIAASGGGSRAAYFLACVLDELRRIEVKGRRAGEGPASLLDEVDYVSSVSGGSLASTYYVLKRPPTSAPGELDEFFARFRADMRKQYELRSVGRTLFLFYWLPLVLTYYHRGHVMASTWDANLFDSATFADLPEPAPPIPSLVVNATSYTSGHKFLFTRLATSRFNDSSFFAGLRRDRLNSLGYDARHHPLESIGFDTLDSDIGPFKLSLAVVASAGVPNLLGPIVLRDRTQDDAYEALGDGGIYDNYGLETLVQLFARILEERPGMRARILVVDGSGYFGVERDAFGYSVAGYSDRTVSIAWLRGFAYAEPLYRSLAQAGPAYRNLQVQILSLYHRGVRPEGERAIVERAVGAVVEPVVGFFDELNGRARAIGTRFKLSDEDADAIETLARYAVDDVLDPKSRPWR